MNKRIGAAVAAFGLTVAMAGLTVPAANAHTIGLHDNCTNFNNLSANGVGTRTARDRGGNSTNFLRSNKTYWAAERHNGDLDRDNDRIACEQRLIAEAGHPDEPAGGLVPEPAEAPRAPQVLGRGAVDRARSRSAAPTPGPPPTRRPGWVRRHKVISTLVALLVIGWAVQAAGVEPDGRGDSARDGTPQAALPADADASRVEESRARSATRRRLHVRRKTAPQRPTGTVTATAVRRRPHRLRSRHRRGGPELPGDPGDRRRHDRARQRQRRTRRRDRHARPRAVWL